MIILIVILFGVISSLVLYEKTGIYILILYNYRRFRTEDKYLEYYDYMYDTSDYGSLIPKIPTLTTFENYKTLHNDARDYAFYVTMGYCNLALTYILKKFMLLFIIPAMLCWRYSIIFILTELFIFVVSLLNEKRQGHKVSHYIIVLYDTVMIDCAERLEKGTFSFRDPE